LGLSGRVPHRVGAATKAALLDLLDQALEAGWPLRRACRVVELPQRRAHRWIARRARGQLADQPPGGSPVHRLLAEEAEQILALFDEWGELDRSHRKLAHRGSYLQRVWVSPSSVRRVLHLADKHFRPLPRPAKSVRKLFPDWVEFTPNSIWIYDTTHFPAAGMAVLIIEDLVSRKWLTEVVSVEETSTQVEVGFTAALQAEGLLETVDDNGPQMRSGSTREIHGAMRDRAALRPPRHPNRPVLDRKLQRAPEGRVPAPAGDPRPGHTARRTGRRAGAIQRDKTPPGHRICDAQRRTRRTR